MTIPTPIPRADTVGSLLRPDSLLIARDNSAAISMPSLLQVAENAAVRQAIALQEEAGLDVITDGEMRRRGWAVTTEALRGFEPRAVGPGLTWHGQSGSPLPTRSGYPTVVRRIAPRRRLVEEYAFLRANARARTKYCLPAPSYHRRFWYPEHSTGAYPTCEDFLAAIRDYERQVVEELIEAGCDYIQLDAPNYGSLCDPEHRRHLAGQGHHLDAELAFDIEIDSSLFDGLDGVTCALHVCRGNAAGRWHSTGGYAVIAERLFPGLRVDTLLLEYDSDRAGDFEPLACIPAGTIAVLGLVTTKSGGIEDEREIEARIAEAARIKPLDELALSPQCGFASVAAGNPVTPGEQRAKLELVARVAHRVWT